MNIQWLLATFNGGCGSFNLLSEFFQPFSGWLIVFLAFLQVLQAPLEPVLMDEQAFFYDFFIHGSGNNRKQLTVN